MAVTMDLICSGCELILIDQMSTSEGDMHQCGGILQWMPSQVKQLDPGTHTSEKVVVYESLKEGGKIQYPGRNDEPVPARLQQRGYERKEINVAELGRFERQHGISNERRHFDRNGRGF